MDFCKFACPFDFCNGMDHLIKWQFLNYLNNVSPREYIKNVSASKKKETLRAFFTTYRPVPIHLASKMNDIDPHGDPFLQGF